MTIHSTFLVGAYVGAATKPYPYVDSIIFLANVAKILPNQPRIGLKRYCIIR